MSDPLARSRGPLRDERDAWDAQEFLITVDWAKYVCMMEKGEVAQLLRMYFVEVVKRYVASVTSLAICQAKREVLSENFRAMMDADVTMSVSRYVRARGVSVWHAAKIRFLALEFENDLLRARRVGYLTPVGRDELDGEFVYTLFDLGVWWDPVGFEMWRRVAPAAADAYWAQVRRTELGPAARGRFERFDVSREELRLVLPGTEPEPPV